ncbi:CD48 antigen [Cynocephalus volans]|uniref:CD48 antigen n=1 Tax=Cynocephalus volans TaxID=110931 RepID=UPI002FCBBFA7
MITVSGSNVSLQISESLPDNYKQLTWFYGPDQKIVEQEFGRPPMYFDTSFKGRVMLHSPSGVLCIFTVRKEDSSTYLLKVLKKTKNEKVWKVPLEVLDPVPKPQIKIEKTEEIENNCYLKLSCKVLDQSVNYTWYGDSGPFPKGLQNSVLEITSTKQNYSKFYTCQASNPVSSKNDTLYFTPPCTLARSSGVAWITTWLEVMVPTVLGILLI